MSWNPCCWRTDRTLPSTTWPGTGWPTHGSSSCSGFRNSCESPSRFLNGVGPTVGIKPDPVTECGKRCDVISGTKDVKDYFSRQRVDFKNIFGADSLRPSSH